VSESGFESLSLAGSIPQQCCTHYLNERLNYMLFKAKVKKKMQKNGARLGAVDLKLKLD
jgi:hypothetical protein